MKKGGALNFKGLSQDGDGPIFLKSPRLTVVHLLRTLKHGSFSTEIQKLKILQFFDGSILRVFLIGSTQLSS